MITLLLNSILLILLNITNANAQSTPPNYDLNDPQATAEQMMMQYDFNRDGIVTEKEFFVGNGDSGYRAHLSNIHKSLDINTHDNITKQQYWFIEMANPAKYQQDLLNYFTYMDKDGDGYVTIEEYKNTFEGIYPPQIGNEYAKIMDADQDGRISKEEYINFDFTTLPTGDHEVFRNLDANHDKIITLEEFKHSFDYFNKPW